MNQQTVVINGVEYAPIQTQQAPPTSAARPAIPPRPRSKSIIHILLLPLWVFGANFAYGFHIRHKQKLWDWRYIPGKERPSKKSGNAALYSVLISIGLWIWMPIGAALYGGNSSAGAAETVPSSTITVAEQREDTNAERRAEREAREALIQQALQSLEITRPMDNMNFFVLEMHLDVDVESIVASSAFNRIFDDYVNRRQGEGEMDFFLFTPTCTWSGFGTFDSRGRIDWGQLEASGWRNDDSSTPC